MVKEYRLLFTSDVHGNKGQITTALRRATQLGLDAVVFGGDIAPKEGNSKDGAHWKPGHKTRNPEAQRRFYEDFMVPIFSSIQGLNIYIMMGNDDFRANLGLLEKIGEEGKFRLLHDRTYKLPNGLSITGSPWINLTPFLNKDWEMHDTSDPVITDKSKERLRYSGFIADPSGDLKVDFNSVPLAESLEQLLFHIIKPLSPPNKTVYVFHTPPYRTNLDQIVEDGKVIHVGSVAVRRFFERVGGILGLHGHIHQTVDISGQFQDRVGNVIVASPGNSPYNVPTNNYTNYRNSVDVLVAEISLGKVGIRRERIDFDKNHNIVNIN